MAEPYNSNPEQPWEPVELIPLAEAVFCGQCGNITRSKNGHCMGCGSTAIVNIEACWSRGGCQAGPIPLVSSRDGPPGLRILPADAP